MADGNIWSERQPHSQSSIRAGNHAAPDSNLLYYTIQQCPLKYVVQSPLREVLHVLQNLSYLHDESPWHDDNAVLSSTSVYIRVNMIQSRFASLDSPIPYKLKVEAPNKHVVCNTSQVILFEKTVSFSYLRNSTIYINNKDRLT